MKKRVGVLIFFVISYLLTFSNCFSQDSDHLLKPTENINELKKKCMEAAIRGMNRDIEMLRDRVQNYRGISKPGGEKRLEDARRQLAKLEEEVKRYKNLTPDDYQLPEKKELVAWVYYAKPKENAQINFSPQSMSGPFYHMTGINNNNYDIIQTSSSFREPENKYLMTIYLVYRKYNPFLNYCVYIDSLKKIQE